MVTMSRPGKVHRLEVGHRRRSGGACARPRRQRRRCGARDPAGRPRRPARAAARAGRRGGSRGPARPPFSSFSSARSVTICPLTRSAGHVAHQFTTSTRSPFSEATFQNALAPRSTELAGCVRVRRSRSAAAPTARLKRVRSASGTGVRMPGRWRAPAEWIPWTAGPRPVAIVVQTMAGTCSGSARSGAWADAASSACRCGISPRAIISSAMRRSSPSIPTIRTTIPVGITAKSTGGGDGLAPQDRGARHRGAERDGDGGDQRQQVAAREARLRQPPAEAAGGEHGHRGQRAEATQRGAQGDAHQQRRRLHRRWTSPRRASATTTRRRRGRAWPGPGPRRGSGSGGGGASAGCRATPRRGPARSVAAAITAPRITVRYRARTSRSRGSVRSRGSMPAAARVEAAPNSTPPRRPTRAAARQRGAERRGRLRAGQHEPIDAVVEVAEPPQLLAHVVDLRERRPRRAHAGL